MKGYGPPDPRIDPPFAGTPTFLRLPYPHHLTDVDVAIVGLPFDTGSTGHTGARFGPRAIRERSLPMWPHYNPAQRVAVFDRLSAVDWGDARIVPASVERSLELMQARLDEVQAAGAVPIGLGGDHTVLLAGLRAAAAHHGGAGGGPGGRGPLALILFDAHHDADDDDFGAAYGHGTPVRRALEEGLIDARRSTILGLRGGMSGEHDHDRLRDDGFAVFSSDELMQIGTGAAAAAVERAGDDGAAFLSFDIDFVDPAFAPGTGTPEVGGPSSAQALALLRGCRGLDIVGADVVEVVPDLDHVGLTATLAATIAWEILSLIACRPPRGSA